MIYPWLDTQWQNMLQQIRQQRLPQALLIEGPSGMGRSALAQTLAQHVLCQNPNTLPCGHCRSCSLFLAGNHPDYLTAIPEEETKLIKVEQIRDVIAALEQRSHQGGYQVALIAPAHAMNRASANALLKTLEEPSAKVLIMLITDRLSALPPTVLSRCQRLSCVGQENQEAAQWLRAQLGPHPDIDFLLRVSDYAPLRALEFAQLKYKEQRDQMLQDFLELKQNQLEASKLAAEWVKADLDFLWPMLQWIALDLLRLSLRVDERYIMHRDNLAALSRLQKLGGVHEWLAFLQKVQKAWDLYSLSNNVNRQMLLEGVFV